MYYLLTYKATWAEDGDTLYLMKSSLGEALTKRLLTFMMDADMLVYAAIDEVDVRWQGAGRPAKFVHLSRFIEPLMFTTSSRKDDFWLLLNHSEAKEVLKMFLLDPAYSEETAAGKTNYYKNAVDCFKHMMENKWSKQAK